MKKLNHKNALSATVSMLMTLTVCSSVSQASDIDIYSNSTGGESYLNVGDRYFSKYGRSGRSQISAKRFRYSNQCKWHKRMLLWNVFEYSRPSNWGMGS